jgi:hypothetical protein
VSTQTREVRPFNLPRKVLADGVLLDVPDGWELLPPGDPALSRRIKADGPSWTVIELKGNKRFSRGIWAPADRIGALRAELATDAGALLGRDGREQRAERGGRDEHGGLGLDRDGAAREIELDGAREVRAGGHVGRAS